MKCCKCKGPISPKLSKIAAALGCSVAALAFGMAIGVSSGWLGLIAASMAGGNSQKINQMVRLKAALSKESAKYGSYFECRTCDRDVSLFEVFG